MRIYFQRAISKLTNSQPTREKKWCLAFSPKGAQGLCRVEGRLAGGGQGSWIRGWLDHGSCSHASDA